MSKAPLVERIESLAGLSASVAHSLNYDICVLDWFSHDAACLFCCGGVL